MDLGEDLRTYLRRSRRDRHCRLGSVQAFNLFRRFAHGLSHFHRRGNMVHGDLKPANLILCRDARRLIMVDFGSAWTVEKTMVRELGDGETAAYASPEQNQRQAFVDFRSDQFSATVIAYEMLTGDLPYDKMGGKAGRPENRSDFEGKLIPPSRCCRDQRPLPKGAWTKIDDVITKGLALDPEDRYESDKPWLNDLDEIDTILNRPPQTSSFSRFLQTAIETLPPFLRPRV